MPTYDYECDACGHTFEKFQPITENPLRKCPACGKLKARRLIGTGGAILFKGNGFYITDYRSKEYREAAKKETSGEASSTKSDAAKSESSPSKKTSEG
jgi:putative FmdB family regulatory protein